MDCRFLAGSYLFLQFCKLPAACRKTYPENVIPILLVQDVVFYKLRDPLNQVTFLCHCQFQWNHLKMDIKKALCSTADTECFLLNMFNYLIVAILLFEKEVNQPYNLDSLHGSCRICGHCNDNLLIIIPNSH